MIDRKFLKLYAVTDRAWLDGRSLEDVIREVILGGVTLVQLREKELSDEAFFEEARRVKAICDAYRVPLIINDNVEIARKLGVGVHVGQHDAELSAARAAVGPDAVVGVSCDTVAQAIAAERGGADYLGVGAVFPTSTKADAEAVSMRELTAICAAVSIPVVAIGGITRDNLTQLASSGIAGISVVSALFAAKNPRAAAEDLSIKTEGMLSLPANRLPGAIIDLDGTLLDSLPYWEHLGAHYLESKGKTPEPGLQKRLDAMELDESAEYLRTAYGLAEDAQTIRAELLAAIRHVYEDDAPLLPHALPLLQKLHAQHVRMALFTSAEKTAAEAALRRTNIREYFDCIVSTVGAGLDKARPDAYYYVLGQLGTALDSTTIYEDAPYAVAGARLTGMNVITPDEL